MDRLQCGIGGFDEILEGGLVAGASYIVQGRPGSGKTILANQIAFHHAAGGGRVLVATLLSESHERLLQFLSTLAFFDPARVGAEISYVSAFETLEDEGLDGVVTLIRREISRHGATVLIVDGLLNARSRAETQLDTKKFIAALQGHAAFAGCTVLFLTSARLEDSSPEHTMVDGVIELAEEIVGVRSVRRMQMKKTRGTGALGGLHEFEITGHGIRVHPRLESRSIGSRAPDDPEDRRVSTGIGDLDRMVGGGLPVGSSTLVIGASGTGKTSMALAFAAEATRAEPAVVLGLFETPPRLEAKGAALGLDIAGLRAAGVLHPVWVPPTDQILDAIAYRVLDTVRETGARRLVIDSIGALARRGSTEGRDVPFFMSLFNALRSLGVTVFATWETADIVGTPSRAPAPNIASITDNLLLMRFVERGTELKRVLSIVKIRHSAYDASVHEFVTTPTGLHFRPTGPVAAFSPGAAPTA
nr:ATPase domain-containing protein [Chthonobacter rhizosphaerae]